jgi:hypothetical protein
MADAELKFYDSFGSDLFKVMHDIGYEEIGELRYAGDLRSIPVPDHSGCLIAGLDETRFGKMAPNQIVSQARVAIAESGRPKLILSPGCSVPDNVSIDRLVAIRKAAC